MSGKAKVSKVMGIREEIPSTKQKNKAKHIKASIQRLRKRVNAIEQTFPKIKNTWNSYLLKDISANKTTHRLESSEESTNNLEKKCLKRIQEQSPWRSVSLDTGCSGTSNSFADDDPEMQYMPN